jgi:hypothetical protein
MLTCLYLYSKHTTELGRASLIAATAGGTRTYIVTDKSLEKNCGEEARSIGGSTAAIQAADPAQFRLQTLLT